MDLAKINTDITKFNHGVLFFYASWEPAAPKTQMFRRLDNIETFLTDVPFLAVEIDAFKAMTTDFGIKSVPTIIPIVHGKKQKPIVGYILSSALRNTLTNIFKEKNV